MRICILIGLLVSTTSFARPIKVYLDRDGGKVGRVVLPGFEGSDAAWQDIVACVQRQYAPFTVDFVEQRPASRPYITVMFGGLASQLGMDDAKVGGISPYEGFGVVWNAVAHVFSEYRDDAHNAENLCGIAAHEIGHALGLDHTLLCGDVMSYCGQNEFINKAAPCGEYKRRVCGNGDGRQNSYWLLGQLVGFRKVAPKP